jgi:Tol biopolymer transport system component
VAHVPGKRRWACAVVLAGLVYAIYSGAAGRAAQAAYPGANGRIAYAGNPSTVLDVDIFTVLPSGSGVRHLTNAPVSEFSPSWSADGRQLTYLRPVSDGDQVFRMRADGSNQTRVTNDVADDSSPSFSPNGNRIAYAKDNSPFASPEHPRRVSVFTIRSDGSDPRLVVTGYVRAAEYSPDGRRIVFEGHPTGKPMDSYAIWTIRPNGSHLRRLTAPENGGNSDQTPAWSPDGEHIVFLRCDRDSTHGCEGRLFLMRANGSYKRPIQPILGEVAPTFSPTGNRIALTYYQFRRLQRHLHDLARGVQPQPVWRSSQLWVSNGGPGGFAAQPSWQPLPAG